MSGGSVEKSEPIILAMTSSLMHIDRSCDSEGLRRGDSNPAQLLADSSSLVQAHTVSDPVFAPVRKLPPEMLAKIFIKCIPSLLCESPPFKNGMWPHQVRGRLGRVCRLWNTVLNDEPGVWATLVLDRQPPPLENVSLWIKRSKSHPLDVSLRIDRKGYMDDDRDGGDVVVEMLQSELWRIRSFLVEDFTNYDDISPLFPPDLLTVAPMMESLALRCHSGAYGGQLGCLHCPQLRTLSLRNCDEVVESLTSKPMQDLRVLTIHDLDGNDMPYIKLLQALPNLVSLTWTNSERPLRGEIPRVALPSLKSLTFPLCHWRIMARLLRHLDVPSLEHLDLGYCIDDHGGNLNMILDVICGDGAVQLRRLTLGDNGLKGVNFHAMWPHLKHLETLFISDAHDIVPADGLCIALSPPNRDFNSLCPQLKTLELSSVYISTGVLLDFVQRRVRPDIGDPAPGLLTCLKLSDVWVNKKVWIDEDVPAQLAKTHSSSVHL